MGKTGRPYKEIDKKLFENLCGIMCTEAEMCNLLDVTDKTLNSWCKRTYGKSFSEVYKKYSDTGRISLRRLQFQHAKKSVPMAIFLGKQYLGQRDYKSVDVTADDGKLEKLDEVLKKIQGNVGSI